MLAVGPGAPASIGTDIPLIYNGAAPSTVKKELIGPYQLLRSGQLDTSTDPATITLPLYQGKLKGGNILIAVHVETAEASKSAKEALDRSGAHDIVSTSETSVPNKNRDEGVSRA